MKLRRQQLLFTCAAIALRGVSSLSLSTSDAANLARGRLQESLSSISKKITISPEIIIPEPSDPTALLLQSTDVTKMSQGIRSNAKANAAFISGSVNAVRAFCAEQEAARGSFPGPLPVVYCESLNNGQISIDLADLAQAGVSGVLYTLLNGEEISSVEEIEDDNIEALFQSTIENGMQLIPEIVLNPESEWDEATTKSLLDTIVEKCGSQPTAVLLTVGKTLLQDDNDAEDSGDMSDCVFPKVPKDSPTVLGSVRAVAGGGRIGSSVQACKEAGFNGVVLRCDCLPGFRMNPDLDFVQKFWGAAIGDLKSTKSKHFNFRSKVTLEKDIPLEWFNYQKDVMDSGALGESSANAGPNPLDSDNGDYKGF